MVHVPCLRLGMTSLPPRIGRASYGHLYPAAEPWESAFSCLMFSAWQLHAARESDILANQKCLRTRASALQFQDSLPLRRASPTTAVFRWGADTGGGCVPRLKPQRFGIQMIPRAG
jgi:hypothetical protein